MFDDTKTVIHHRTSNKMAKKTNQVIVDNTEHIKLRTKQHEPD